MLPSTPEEFLVDLQGLDEQTLLEQARAWVGEAVGEPLEGPDPVNLPMIRHFCEAIGDTNPVHLDDETASATRHKGVIAPPAMLGVWTMGTPRNAGGPRDQVLRRLDAAGYTSVVATDYTHEYLVPLRPGDHVHERRSIEDLTGPKATALGDGWFVTSRYDYHTADGTLVGVGRMRLLKFRPRPRVTGAPDAAPAAATTAATTGARRPRPVVNRDTRYWWDGVAARELRIQRCTGCGALRHPGGPMCPRCRSVEHDWVVASGRGVVHSHVVHHHPPLPGVELPHVVVLVELEESAVNGDAGPIRVVADVVDMTPRQVRVGMPVELQWKPLESDDPDGLVVPAFAPAPGALPPVPDAPRVFEDVAVGMELPGFDVEMTPTFIISAALATRDFEEVHHDRDLARARGSEDLFPNILTSNGLALRLVTDWLGPDAVIERAAVRLGLPAYVGEVLRMRGEVVRVTPRSDMGDGEIEFRVWGRISTGDHLTGTVIASLPRSDQQEVPA